MDTFWYQQRKQQQINRNHTEYPFTKIISLYCGNIPADLQQEIFKFIPYKMEVEIHSKMANIRYMSRILFEWHILVINVDFT